MAACSSAARSRSGGGLNHWLPFRAARADRDAVGRQRRGSGDADARRRRGARPARRISRRRVVAAIWGPLVARRVSREPADRGGHQLLSERPLQSRGVVARAPICASVAIPSCSSGSTDELAALRARRAGVRPRARATRRRAVAGRRRSATLSASAAGTVRRGPSARRRGECRCADP